MELPCGAIHRTEHREVQFLSFSIISKNQSKDKRLSCVLVVGRLSALHRAAGHGHGDCVRDLLAHDANVVQLNREGQTALFQVGSFAMHCNSTSFHTCQTVHLP